MTFQEPKGMLRLIEVVKDNRAGRWKGREVEGLVLEDAAGFQFKAKAADYAFWKALRGQKDCIVSAREAGHKPDLKPMASARGAGLPRLGPLAAERRAEAGRDLPPPRLPDGLRVRLCPASAPSPPSTRTRRYAATGWRWRRWRSRAPRTRTSPRWSGGS